jgi:hypothetical protein
VLPISSVIDLAIFGFVRTPTMSPSLETCIETAGARPAECSGAVGLTT